MAANKKVTATLLNLGMSMFEVGNKTPYFYDIDVRGKKNGTFISALSKAGEFNDLSAGHVAIGMAYGAKNNVCYAEAKLKVGTAIALVYNGEAYLYLQTGTKGHKVLQADNIMNSSFENQSHQLINAALLAAGMSKKYKADAQKKLSGMLNLIKMNPTIHDYFVKSAPACPSEMVEAMKAVSEIIDLTVTEGKDRGIFKDSDSMSYEVSITTAPPKDIDSLWEDIKGGALTGLENPNCFIEGETPTGINYRRLWFTPVDNDPALLSEEDKALAERYYGRMCKNPPRIVDQIFAMIHAHILIGEYANILLLGDPGAGKTTVPRIMSTMVGVKVHVYQIALNDDTTSIWGSYQPRIRKKASEKNPYSIREAIKDPATAWKKLHGSEYDASIPRTQVITETADAIAAWAYENGRKDSAGPGMELVWVDSAITKAFREGGILLVDEIDKCKNPEVLNVFNTLFATSGNTSYTLPNGEVIKRSSKLVVILAGNYNRAIDTSLVSRCQDKYDLQTPTAEELARRAIENNTTVNGILLTKDTAGAQKMAKCVKEMAAMARSEDIRDGSIGERELTACVTKAAMLQCMDDGVMLGETRDKISEKNWVMAAVTTIYNKCSQDADSRNQLSAVLANAYSEVVVQRALQDMSDFVNV